MTKKHSLWKWLTGGALGVGAVLLVTWFAVPVLASLLPASTVMRSAQIGDMFGFAGAMFAGIGLVGVALALLFETVDRRQARRPFVTMLPKDERIEIRKANWDGTVLNVRVRVELELLNDSSEPALNVRVGTPDLPSLGAGPSEVAVAVPLGASRSQSVVLQSRLHGQAAADWLRKLKTGEPTFAVFEARYTSLNSVKWLTTMQLEIACLRSADQTRLGDVLDPASGVTIDGNTDEDFGPDSVVLSFSIVQGSWSQNPE